MSLCEVQHRSTDSGLYEVLEESRWNHTMHYVIAEAESMKVFKHTWSNYSKHVELWEENTSDGIL